MELRDYQVDALEKIYAAWAEGYLGVMLQLATGAGKTVTFCEILKNHKGRAIVIAHRNQLVAQTSLCLAKNGVYHDIIASKSAIRVIAALHRFHLGKSFYRPQRHIIAAGVDTLITHKNPTFKDVSLAIVDEGHHVLRKNKWGKALEMFPNARVLLPTATPLRADGYGLGRNADGVADVLIEGVGMRELIKRGCLSDYQIAMPPSDLKLDSVKISAGGDYSPVGLKAAARQSHIIGDIVQHYLRFASGKLGLTFVTDLETAADVAQSYRDAGVPAEVISGKTDELTRARLMRKFENREILQLISVDLLGEGVDVPAIEVVSFARPTKSYSLYAQQFGRALRPFPGKTHAIIIDHVGNVLQHGLPDDTRRAWSLSGRDKRTAGESSAFIRACANCFLVYEKHLTACPFCGHKEAPTGRSTPEMVEGDLTLLDAAAIAQLRGEITRIDSEPQFPAAIKNNTGARLRLIRIHEERQEAQHELREAIAQWAGYKKAEGLNDAEIYRFFYISFGTDVMTAQTLNAKDAAALYARIARANSQNQKGEK